MAKKRKNPAAVALGRLGGRRKVPKGIATLSAEERSRRAREAAAARWGKNSDQTAGSVRKRPKK